MGAILRVTLISGFINTQPLITGIPGVSPRCHEFSRRLNKLALLTLYLLRVHGGKIASWGENTKTMGENTASLCAPAIKSVHYNLYAYYILPR